MKRLRTYSIRGLIIAVAIVAVLCAWMAREIHNYERWIAASETLTPYIYTAGCEELPWYVRAAYRLKGRDEPTCYRDFIIFHDFNSITDETLSQVVWIRDLSQLWLNRDLEITDEGLRQLESLSQLTELKLGDAPVSAAAVQRLRRALPACSIEWQPRRPDAAEPTPSSDSPFIEGVP